MEDTDDDAHFCPVCGLPGALTCEACESVFYCGEEHREHDAEKHGKEECARLQSERDPMKEALWELRTRPADFVAKIRELAPNGEHGELNSVVFNANLFHAAVAMWPGDPCRAYCFVVLCRMECPREVPEKAKLWSLLEESAFNFKRWLRLCKKKFKGAPWSQDGARIDGIQRGEMGTLKRMKRTPNDAALCVMISCVSSMHAQEMTREKKFRLIGEASGRLWTWYDAKAIRPLADLWTSIAAEEGKEEWRIAK